MQQLATRLKLSIGTISRALANDPAIAEKTRRRVAEAAAKHGYRYNSAARALITGRTSIIGVHVLNFSSFYVEMALRLERIIASDGYMAVVHSSPTPLATWIPDGEIALNAFWTATSVSGRPVVGSITHPREDYVAVDLATPTRAAIHHLASTGCRRIAMLSHAQHTVVETIAGHRYIDQRIAAYHQTMHDLTLPIEIIPLTMGTRALARQVVHDHLASHPTPPDALLCHNDDAAVGAYRAVLDRGLRVPEDISIIGCDGVEVGEYLAQPLSSIVQPLDDRARFYWTFLRQRLTDPGLPQQTIELPARLALRATTR